MKTRTRIEEILQFFKFSDTVIEKVLNAYNHKGRYYHNLKHIIEMLEYADRTCGKLSEEEQTALYMAIIFHDVVYDTRSKTNEEDSFIFFQEAIGPFSAFLHTDEWLKWERIEIKVKEMIMATKAHEYEESLPEYVKIIIRADLERLTLPFPTFWENTKQIMKEYYWVDFSDFKKGRMEFFESYGEKVAFMGDVATKNIELAYHTLSVWEPVIGVYPGSFNPIHIGHVRILERAERIFDKVILARGVNPEKKGAAVGELPESIINSYQVDTYSGLLTDYLKTKEYPLTVIRGLRSGMDLHAEITQYRYLQDIMPEIQLINIFSDSDVEHISSSGIKLLKGYMDKTPYEL